jgi:hypothetical protein
MPKLSSRNFRSLASRLTSRSSGLRGSGTGVARGGGPLGLLGEHVGSPQHLQGLGHYVACGQLLGGLRPVVRYCDPRRVRAGVVKSELDQARRGQPA